IVALPLLSTLAKALVIALAEVRVAIATVAPITPVITTIIFPVIALAVGTSAVAVRIGLVIQYLKHPSENTQNSQEDTKKTT
ncbi:hypothetical protein CCUS01_02864, partial [Colletotrichum cuscutae]